MQLVAYSFGRQLVSWTEMSILDYQQCQYRDAHDFWRIIEDAANIECKIEIKGCWLASKKQMRGDSSGCCA